MVNASSLYNVFYDNYSPMITDEYLESISEYMYTSIPKKEICKSPKEEPVSVEVVSEPESLIPPPPPVLIKPKMVEETIIPETKNTLFWSIFIGNYGYEEYLDVGGKYLNREIEEKQKIVASFSNNKKLKTSNHKITNVGMQEIIADLSVVKDEVYSNLVAYSIFYGKHIYFLMNHSYLEFYPTEEMPSPEEDEFTDMSNVIVITMQPKTNRKQRIFGVELNLSKVGLNQLLKSRIHLEHYNRPLRGVSSYKSGELDEMMRNIQPLADISTAKMKKTDIYNYIAERIMLDYST